MKTGRSIVIVTGRSGFPNGAGAAARLRTWAKGFVRSGYECFVIPLKPSEPPKGAPLNCDAEGSYEGVRFQYAPGTARSARRVPGRVWLVIRSIFGLARALRSASKRAPIAAIYFYMPEDLVYLVAVYVASRVLGAKLIGERSEARTAMRGWRGRLFERHAYKLFDGYVVISEYLQSYMAPRLRQAVPLVVVPIQVDTDLFPVERSDAACPDDIVIYCGSTHDNDDVPNCVRVFAGACVGQGQWKLQIVGRVSSDTKAQLEALAKALGVSGRVTFTGGVPAEQIPRLLTRAKIAILPRSLGLFSTAGFPTKLGEYLASGRPVIVTATGDIPKFLRNGEEALLVPPGDLEAFSSRLREVMTAYEDYRELGARGRRAACERFDYRAGCRELLGTMGLER